MGLSKSSATTVAWPVFTIEPIDTRQQLGLRQVTFVVAEDAVARVCEPDGSLRRDHHVVGAGKLWRPNEAGPAGCAPRALIYVHSMTHKIVGLAMRLG